MVVFVAAAVYSVNFFCFLGGSVFFFVLLACVFVGLLSTPSTGSWGVNALASRVEVGVSLKPSSGV